MQQKFPDWKRFNTDRIMESITLQQKDIVLTKETATSKIIFTNDRIYKVKKNVVIFPFIDYSTGEERYTRITREFTKGKEYSPEIYICQTLLNGPNIINEPSICMSRGDSSRSTLFDYLSTHVSNSLILDDLLNDIKRFHTHTRMVLPAADHGIMSLKRRFSMLCEEATVLNKKLDKNYLQLIDSNIAYYDAEYSNRFSRGFIRELHGDLHTNNILYDEKNFYLFDFLDFDDSYTTGDYLQDIGFLLADMYFFGVLQMESNKIEEIANFFNDRPGLLLLFSAYGALNRANVFEYDKQYKANLFYDISYMLLLKGKEYL